MIGEKLKEIREQKRFSVDELATKSGISRVTIWKIETGKVSPNADTLQALAKTLDINAGVFFADPVNCSLQNKESA